ncbi:MAG: septum formation initiator family protein [Acidimicrobiia bacterium]|nr:septum formation initiator family protein [Acidimicrobiia bacterium]
MTRRRIPMLATTLVFFLAVMLVGLVPFRQILTQREAVSDAEDRLVALEHANAQLADELAALETPVEVERRAREDFGLVRPGEVAYIVVPEDPVEPIVEETVRRGDGSWFDAIVDFFTGRDGG